MKLFQKNKNIIFESISDIINDIVQNHAVYTKRDLEQYFENRNLLLYEHKEILDNENFVLYENRQNGQIAPRIRLPIPYCPQAAEQQCMRELSEDTVASLFLKEETIQKIKQHFRKEGEPVFLSRNRKENTILDNGKMREHIRTLMQAILHSHLIRITAAGTQSEFIPYRLSYSNRENGIHLYGIKNQDAISIPIEDIEQITLLEKSRDIHVEQWIARQKRHMELQIEEKKNIVERCFCMFSHLKKSAVYDRTLHQYILHADYYSFEEKAIIRDLMSFGSYIIVLKPEDLRNKMIEMISKI